MADTRSMTHLRSLRAIHTDLLGVKDPTELIKVAELRREAIK